MYDLPMLGISDSLKAMQVMLEEALKEPERPVSIAIVDSQGLTIQFARICLLYTSPSPRDKRQSRMPSSA